jgi:hypothetical protein
MYLKLNPARELARVGSVMVTAPPERTKVFP